MSTLVSPPALKRISRETLSSLLLSPTASSTLAIIDVRGDDHVGGHIRSSINAPIGTLDYRMPELVRTLKEKKMVVFHCALSQERGPRAARWYLEERARRERMEKGHVPQEEQTEGEEDGQEVFVLDKGFVGWQEVYGTDERLTEAYAPDIWVDY